MVAEKVFGGDNGDVAVEFRNCADPGALGEFAGGAADEFDVRQAHVGRVMNDFAVFDHHEHGVAVAHFDFVMHQ